MDEKFWLKSKTILALIPLIVSGLGMFADALVKWIDAGHGIDGVFTVVWPAALAFLSTLAAIFRAKATTTLTTEPKP